MPEKEQEKNNQTKERPPLPERPKASTIYETFSLSTIKGEKRKK